MDQVIFKMTKDSNNLIVFLNSDPLVRRKGPKLQAVSSERELNIEIEKLQTLQVLSRMDLQINIKYDILNMKNLRQTAENGCRILVLSFQQYHDENLCLDTDNGLQQEIDS